MQTMDIEKQIQQEKTTTSLSSPTQFLSFFFLLSIYLIVSQPATRTDGISKSR